MGDKEVEEVHKVLDRKVQGEELVEVDCCYCFDIAAVVVVEVVVVYNCVQQQHHVIPSPMLQYATGLDAILCPQPLLVKLVAAV